MCHSCVSSFWFIVYGVILGAFGIELVRDRGMVFIRRCDAGGTWRGTGHDGGLLLKIAARHSQRADDPSCAMAPPINEHDGPTAHPSAIPRLWVRSPRSASASTNKAPREPITIAPRPGSVLLHAHLATWCAGSSPPDVKTASRGELGRCGINLGDEFASGALRFQVLWGMADGGLNSNGKE